jgi:hypothetical protein
MPIGGCSAERTQSDSTPHYDILLNPEVWAENKKYKIMLKVVVMYEYET